MINTTITGLTAGTAYNVNAHFYDTRAEESNSAWAIQAGFSADSLTLYSAPVDTNDADDFNGTATAAPLASSLSYTGEGPVFAANATITQYAADLGTATADSTGSITVFLDDTSPINAIADARSWYDGVSFQAVPEPASMALLGLGGLALFGRRRR